MVKTPVTYNSTIFTINDADADLLIDLEVTIPRASDIVCGEYTDEVVTKMNSIGNQIANALNNAADQSRVIEELETAIEQFLAWFGSSSQWERENRNAKPVTRKDVRGLRDALRFKDAEAQRIMEGK